MRSQKRSRTEQPWHTGIYASVRRGVVTYLVPTSNIAYAINSPPVKNVVHYKGKPYYEVDREEVRRIRRYLKQE